MRASTLLWSVLGITVVIGLFVVKHEVRNLEDRLHTLNAGIIEDRDATQVLQAEWSYLNQPARLESLSRRLLGMSTPEPSQTITLQHLLSKTKMHRGTNRKATIPKPWQHPGPPLMKVGEDRLAASVIRLKNTQ